MRVLGIYNESKMMHGPIVNFGVFCQGCDGKAVEMFVFKMSARFSFNSKMTVQTDERTEVSLDCSICGKKRRTVIVDQDQIRSYCTPTKHPFPAKIRETQVHQSGTETQFAYIIEYDFVDFEDKRRKWPNTAASAMPKWGRISFEVTCPECNTKNRTSTQNNLVRPHTEHCSCGYALYTENKELPLFEEVH